MSHFSDAKVGSLPSPGNPERSFFRVSVFMGQLCGATKMKSCLSLPFLALIENFLEAELCKNAILDLC